VNCLRKLHNYKRTGYRFKIIFQFRAQKAQKEHYRAIYVAKSGRMRYEEKEAACL